MIRIPERVGRQLDWAVSAVDLYPTILELAGISVPGSAEGRSVLIDAENKDVFFEFKEDGILRGDIKLVTERDTDNVLFCYDLAEDPFEMDDISKNLDTCLKERILSALNTWRARIRQKVEE